MSNLNKWSLQTYLKITSLNNKTGKNQLPTKNQEIREKDDINADASIFKKQMIEQFNGMKKAFPRRSQPVQRQFIKFS